MARVYYEEESDTFDVDCYDPPCQGFLAEFDQERDAGFFADEHEEWHDNQP